MWRWFLRKLYGKFLAETERRISRDVQEQLSRLLENSAGRQAATVSKLEQATRQLDALGVALNIVERQQEKLAGDEARALADLSVEIAATKAYSQTAAAVAQVATSAEIGAKLDQVTRQLAQIAALQFGKTHDEWMKELPRAPRDFTTDDRQ